MGQLYLNAGEKKKIKCINCDMCSYNEWTRAS